MFRGLKPRFIVFLVLILTIAIGFSSFWQLRIQYNHLLDTSKEKLMDIAETIDRSIRPSMQDGRQEHVKSILEAVGTLPEIQNVRIFSKDGIILVSSRPDENGQLIDGAVLENFSKNEPFSVFSEEDKGKPAHYIIKPIMNEPACFPCHGTDLNQINGVLEVGVSMSKIQERISKISKSMVISTLVTLFVLTLSILFLLNRLVNRPIQTLMRTMRKAERGELSVRVHCDDTLEFEELGASFNTMIARLEKAQKDLQKLYEQRMERVRRLATLGELAAGIAHEIKNPIAGIGGAVQVMMENCPEDDERRGIFEEILKQIDRIDRDIKDLLSYTKTEKPEFAEQCINNVVHQSVLLIRDRALQQKVEIKTFYDESNPKVEIDEKQIQQVLVNLGLNAIQAMSDGGVLMFTTQTRNDSPVTKVLEIQVKDTGDGIPEESLSKIFTPFFTTRYTGTGLGLSISQEILRQHRGEVQVKSKPGKGTCFTIFLPMHKES